MSFTDNERLAHETGLLENNKRAMKNKVILVGRTGQDIEAKFVQTDRIVANFSLATSKRIKKGNDEWEEITTWHRVVVWGRRAQFAAKIPKGSIVWIEGEIVYRTYRNAEGVERPITEILSNDISALTWNAKETSDTEGLPPDNPTPQPDDDLPF